MPRPTPPRRARSLPHPVHARLAPLFGATASLLGGCATQGGESGSAADDFRVAHAEFARRATSEAPVQLTGVYLPDAELHNEPGEFDLTHWVLDAAVPIPLSRDTFLLAGALAGQRIYRFDGVPTLADETLHHYAPRFGIGKFLDDDLVVQGYLEPGVYSDLGGTLHSEDWRLWYARALAVWRCDDDLFLKGGFILTDTTDSGALPLVGATWHFARDWRFETLLPRDLKLVWTPGPHWILSGGFRIESNEYHIRGPAALGSPEHDVHAQEVYAFLGAEYLFASGLSTFVRFGAPIAGNYDWSYGTGAPDYDNTLEATPFASAGLGWRF